MKMFRTIVLVVLGAVASQAWAINKCAVAGGGFVFQDLPCVGAGEALKLQSNPSQTGDDAVAKMNATTAKRKRDERVNEAIMKREPLVGMTRAELDQAMGAPTTVNASNYSGKLHDQLIYNHPAQTWYVYTEQGVVTSIQNRPAVGVVATASKAPCPSAHAIRDMETSASSIRLSDAERVERLKQNGEAKKCGQ